LRAAKEVIYRAPNTYFLLVGDGEQMFELIDLAASLGISKNVIFTGFQRGKNLRDAFKIADLFVMPSVSEPFGLTPLEAIGYGGTPSLVSYQSGVIEVLNNCLKVDYWDVNEMANQITSIVQNESLGEELRKNAYKEYEKLSWSKSASEVMDLYNKRLELATV
jgi:glycogen(starch) synthase